MEQIRTLSVVIPVYYSENTIGALVDNICKELNHIKFEIILINDGSTDNSWEAICELKRKYPDIITGINLAKNYGEHNALMAGYRQANAKYIVNIDDDFQNPPKEILKILKYIEELDCDVVYGKYNEKKHAKWRNIGSWLNSWIAEKTFNKPKTLYMSSFRILNNKILQHIIKYKGPFAYIDGLIFRTTRRIEQTEVEHHVSVNKTSRYNLLKLISLWSNTLINFSLFPLRISTLIGSVFSIIGVTMGIYYMFDKIFNPEIQIGWSSVIVTVMVFSGIQLMMIGILGEYIGRIYMENSETPQYIVDEIV
jgi:polyisoprenyl-phosphate glycosyltransferase